MHFGDGCTFGLVPMGAGRTYGFPCVVQPRFRDPLERRLERLRDHLAKFGLRVQEYLASLERDDQVICSSMKWMGLQKWCADRVVLVGDAAHANSPIMGQGGCIAMEDACAGRGIACIGNPGERPCELRRPVQAPSRRAPAPEHGSR